MGECLCVCEGWSGGGFKRCQRTRVDRTRSLAGRGGKLKSNMIQVSDLGSLLLYLFPSFMFPGGWKTR